MLDINVWTVLIAASITAVATGAGALPFLFIKKMSPWWVSVANAFAGGLMLAASHSLIVEGTGHSLIRTLAGMILGLAAIVASNKLIGDHDDLEIGALTGAGARKALLILGIMTAHSFAEGIGVGVSFGGTQELGLFITTAIAIHNIPEGLAISLVLIPRGASVWKAAGWSIFSSLPQPLMAVPAFLFVTAFQPFLPVGLGLAAGAMIWMVFAELIPDALEDASSQAVGSTVVIAFVALIAFQNLVL